MKTLYWRVFTKSSNKKGIESVKNFFESSFSNIELQKEEVYWKDDTLLELEFKQKISENSENVLILVFKQIELISYHWQISFSSNEDGSISEFSGLVSEEIPKLNINWIHFSLEDDG